METIEIIAIAALVLSVFLLIKVFSLQSKLNDIQSELEWIKNRSDHSPMIESSSPITSEPNIYGIDADLEKRLRILIASDQKIKAIKVLREARGISLKDAKNYVDQLET
ncbi:ribosomal protein L7/L12 [Paenibacillus faecalis]|uniref:ribosomal protein L7/L12 n=1 Tax=Paenibacillus faecalis TaxID=2079532 RepID=UPI000D0EE5D4|nr:ribosomal protein L7/L12 [Paenibacillus faecalis]